MSNTDNNAENGHPKDASQSGTGSGSSGGEIKVGSESGDSSSPEVPRVQLAFVGGSRSPTSSPPPRPMRSRSSDRKRSPSGKRVRFTSVSDEETSESDYVSEGDTEMPDVSNAAVRKRNIPSRAARRRPPQRNLHPTSAEGDTLDDSNSSDDNNDGDDDADNDDKTQQAKSFRPSNNGRKPFLNVPRIESMTTTSTEALFAMKHWGGKHGHKRREKTEIEKNIEADNKVYREKVYQSLRWKIRDVCSSMQSREVCNGVPNKVVNYSLILVILLSIVFYFLESYNMSSTVGQCDPNLNPNVSEQMEAGNITCQTFLFDSCQSLCFEVIEGIFTHVFIIELIVNFAVAESLCRKKRWTGYYKESGELLHVVQPHVPFFLDPMNYVDFVSVLPFYLNLSLPGNVGVISSLKLLKVMRVFKMARHFKGSTVMAITLKTSFRGLWIFFCAFTVAVALLAMLIQISDECVNDECVFVDPINTMYYIVVTMTTVGYGDQVPNVDATIPRFWAVLSIFFGSMFIALPLAIVGAKFEAAYKRVYSIEDTCETVSAVQRRQLVLNGAYGMCTRIQAGRDAFTRMKQAFAQGRQIEKLKHRRQLERAMKEIVIDHRKMVTHIDTLTPSTVMLVSQLADSTTLRRDSSADLRDERTNNAPQTSETLPTSGPVSAALTSPTRHRNRRFSSRAVGTHGDHAAAAAAAAAALTKKAPYASQARTGPSSRAARAANTKTPTSGSKSVRQSSSVHVADAAITDSKSTRRNSSDEAKSNSKDHAKPRVVAAKESNAAGKDDEGKEVLDENSFVATVRNISCTRRFVAVEYDDLDREQLGMEKMELDVSVNRITRVSAQAQYNSEKHHEIMRRHMRVGMKVRVWRKDTTYYGISHFMMKERTLNVGLVRDAKAGLKSSKCTTRCRDRLWLMLEAPEAFGRKSLAEKGSRLVALVRVLVLTVSIVGIVVQTMRGFNFYGPDQKACSREAYAWCLNVDSTGGPDYQPDRLPSGLKAADVQYDFQHRLNWPCYPQKCARYSETEDTRKPGYMLLCDEQTSRLTHSTSPNASTTASPKDQLVWPGILEDPWSFPFTDPRLRLNVSCATVASKTTLTWVNGTWGAIVTNTTQVVQGEEAFPSGVKQNLQLQRQLSFGEVAVCGRSKCISNAYTEEGTPPYLLLDAESVSQADVNAFFGSLELFFCITYIADFVVNLVAHRSNKVMDELGGTRYYRSVAMWFELLSALVCTAELVLVTFAARLEDETWGLNHSGSLYYTVWGMPFADWFSTCVMRPLRVMVMIRIAFSFHKVPSMIVVSRAITEVYERLAVPLFFLVVFGILFAGIFFTLETLFYCEAVAFCSDGSPDLLACPGEDGDVPLGVGTVIEYQYTEDKCVITPTSGNPTPCYKTGDTCMMQNLFDAVWLSFATMSTVGYGDLYPQTSLGKVPGMLAAVCGTIYLAMPLAIIGSRFYDIYEEYEKVTSLRSAKAKFQHAIDAVMTINLKRKGLRPATEEAAKSRSPTQLRQEIEFWESMGKSKELPMYKKAVALLAELDAEGGLPKHDVRKNEGEVTTAADGVHSIDSFKGAGGLFATHQLDFLLTYCAYRPPLLEDLTKESFDELEHLHTDLMSVLAAQYLFHDEWDVDPGGPLKRREHDLSQIDKLSLEHQDAGTST